MTDNIKPIQKILFGCPGTGKSYKIREIAEKQLNISFDSDTKILKNTVKTVFHPEYTYGDFMGKLLPLTQGTNVMYKFYPGHFLKVLGMAYRGLIEGNNEHYLLVIDELNRGNAAAIFGTVFQLLDRESDHWSSYEVDVSEMELVGLLNSMGYKPNVQTDGLCYLDGTRFDKFCDNLERDLKNKSNNNGLRVLELLKQNKISIPQNLSIIATINTSDESIYYLDSAFKRRWNWEYISIESSRYMLESKYDTSVQLVVHYKAGDDTLLKWVLIIEKINKIIINNSNLIRRIEDKQIGFWFIKPDDDGKIHLEEVKDKLMFYLWDSVFARDKRPLEEIISEIEEANIKLITYDQFIMSTVNFLYYIIKN
ncbi:restriction endonuclease [Planktothrix agardhii 1806]|uniref:restriction endonuclease n=2 Tax=Planktothrix agardhii TaxID=1160 RepID=UPI001F3A0F2D|nr:restriction endonuclease [Planktothrix agardhii]MCF3571476.1 restriction endonuclease [Planktothrix agardhii 1805]MCF3585632.1 restriction endonuclease [Planktothrix agardhii 1803]MCF3602309.1 restriction endonuclease [Planktothrix agardhii 1804]MCF3616781.1 restriction endonuclease [Planktothrix agardhii 1806]